MENNSNSQVTMAPMQSNPQLQASLVNNPASPDVLPGSFPVSTSSFVTGGRLNRWVASILDSFFLGLIGLPIILVSEFLILGKISFDDSSTNVLSKNPWVLAASLLTVALYRIGLLYKNEATPGKAWRKLKIVQNREFKRINLLNAAAREISQIMYLIPLLGMLLYLVSVILVLFSKNRRALHDLIGGTIVIKQPSV